MIISQQSFVQQQCNGFTQHLLLNSTDNSLKFLKPLYEESLWQNSKYTKVWIN